MPEAQRPHMTRIVEDGAKPLADALLAIYEGPLGGHRVQAVSFVYSGDGISVMVGPDLSDDMREEIYGRFIDGFRAAGWGFSSVFAPRDRRVRASILFDHPSTLTRMA